MGTLYVVSTPIGNLEDVTARVLRILGEVDAVLAEDTRHTRRLMSHFGLSTPLISLHAHNEEARAQEALSRLSDEGTLALVSDAGTPLVSDPGERLVRRVLDAGHKVVPLPGPSAVLAALVGSGFSTVPFLFAGFAPRKGKERHDWLDRLARAQETVVLFESPERLGALLEALCGACGGGREAAVGREITKVHEEFKRGTLEGLARYYQTEGKPRGEVTVVVAPAEASSVGETVDEDSVRLVARGLLSDGISPSQVAKDLALRLDIPRNRAYQIVLDVQAAREASNGEPTNGGSV